MDATLSRLCPVRSAKRAGWFESATVDTNIITYKKSREFQTDVFAQTLSRKLENISEGKSLAPKNSITMNAKGDSFIILSATEKAILDKMTSFGKPLKDWDISMNRGISTGFNEAFIIDGATKDLLIGEDSKSEDIIKPILRGRDIKRYSYEFADKWLIFIPWHFPLHKDDSIQGSSEKAEKEFEKEFPAIYKHLLQYKKQLSNRNKAETGIRYEWYALQRCAATYLEDFEKLKICWKEMGSEPAFIYDINNYYINDTCRVMVGEHLLFLLGFFHSKAGDYCFKKFFAGGGLGNTGFRYKSEFMYDLPIPTPNQKDEREITALVDTILYKKSHNLDTSKEEAKIDIIVYNMYNLTQEEIALIEGKI